MQNINCVIINMSDNLDMIYSCINSFMDCCVNTKKIQNWICISENINNYDKDKLENDFPFVKFVIKTNEESGKSNSMKILKNTINMSDTKYILYFETNWIFIEKGDYIGLLLNTIENIESSDTTDTTDSTDISDELSQHKKIGQVKLNYTNTTDTANMTVPNGFSFEPSLIKTEIFDSIGEISENIYWDKVFSYCFSQNGYFSYHINNLKYPNQMVQTKQNICKNVSKFMGVDSITNNNKIFNIINNDDYVFIPNKDSIGNNIMFIPDKSIGKYFEIADNNDECFCFNTHGYFKNMFELTLVELPNRNFCPDGLYIKKKKLDKYYGNLIEDI